MTDTGDTRFAVIGGTGLQQLAEDAEPARTVATPYGDAQVVAARLGGRPVIFVARHGSGHSIPPHRVNYRANIAALRQLGVTKVLATASVGSLNPALEPGTLALLTQFLDFTRGRASTFYDGGEQGVVHTDMTHPYCPQLRDTLAAAAESVGLPLAHSAVYACTDGPRFETAAEVAMFRQLGADVVGMTNVPEAPLAREARLCYAAVAVIANWAAGTGQEPISHQEVTRATEAQAGRVRALFAAAIEGYREEACGCCGAPPEPGHAAGEQ
jgi:5'-methylthioadenosine phosphorylase